ncbi:multidrug ABC transporter permease [Planobispora rosea]|uniref:Multidrug ABC transporter permease n=1 Tax=Planobispora rosea TaxID=35762 RepID=A0A8J3WI23_PLARO|nr:ABC transporter ATP-binding protein [Planobispora rosea]GGT02185.1 multidrug ABC transporter permease [Planobispora rosea]GIH88441.1 multidrug ABC transporter permease [Planobispora rosea]
MRSRPHAGIADAVALAWHAGPGTLSAYVALTVVGGAVPVAVSWLTKLLLDHLGAGHPDPAPLAALGAGLALAGAAVAVLPRAVTYVTDELRRSASLVADDRLYAAVNSFVGLGRFEDPAFLDRLRLAKQSGGTTPGRVVAALLALIRAGIGVAGFLGSLVVISPVMAVVVLAGAVPVAAAEFLLARRRATMFWRIGPLQRREVFFGSLLTGVDAAKELRLFGTGTHLRERMRADTLAANAAERRTARRETLVQGGLGLLSAVVSGAGLVWVVLEAGAGRVSAGDVTMFVAAVPGVGLALGSLVTEAAGAHYQLLMFAHFRAVVHAGPDLPVRSRPCPLPRLRSGIELRDVWFRYSAGHPWVLRGVDLFIPEGAAFGLVGVNGAGKSTLAKLLCRFYDPDRGAILWDGVDIRDVDPAVLRTRISAVFQDFMTYDLSAAENIGLGDLRGLRDRPRIEAAAREAGAHTVLSALPEGYDTLLSREFYSEADKDDASTGVHLSGGQGQRVSIARALFRSHCELMILDEPSSGLDADAEHELHRRLRRHRSGRTSVLVSHRLAALRDADTIAVIDGGRVTERGSHAELVALGGTYARLFARQAEGYHAGASVTP